MKFKLILSAVLLAVAFGVSAKTKGVLILHPSQIAHVAPYSNAFGMVYRQSGDFAPYAQANQSGLGITVVVTHVIIDLNTGAINLDMSGVIGEINANRGSAEITVLFDEIAHVMVSLCNEGKQLACAGVDNSVLDSISAQFRSGINGVKIWQNFAYTTVIKEMRDNGKLSVMANSDLYSFDCYGHFSVCGDKVVGFFPQMDYGVAVYNAMLAHEMNDPKGRQMMLIAGAFNSEHFNNDLTILAQLETYRELSEYPFIAGVAVFQYVGYAGNPAIEDYMINNFKNW